MVMPLMTPGRLSGKIIRAKGLHTVGSEISGCIDHILVNLDQDIVRSAAP